MKYEYDLSLIDKIEDGYIFFTVSTMQNRINIKESACIWWELHNKNSFINTILRKKEKNVYAGDKCWGWNFYKPYIRLYSGNDEIIFYKQISDDFDIDELHKIWSDINSKLNKQGYWLFDMG